VLSSVPRLLRSSFGTVLAAVTILAGSQACDDLKVAPLNEDAGTADSAPPEDDGATSDSGEDCTTPAPNDPANCGRCGHSCQGGACKAGVCQPLVLATDRRSPVDIAVNGAYVYWVEQGTSTTNGADGRLGRASVAPCDAGCVTHLLEEGQDFTGVAVNAEYAYVTQGRLSTGRVVRVPLDGKPLEVFAPNEPSARRIALESSSAIWINAGAAPSEGLARRRAFDSISDGGVTIGSGLDYPNAIAVRGDKVFITASGQLDFDGYIAITDLTGSSADLIATDQASPRGIAVDSTWAYWANRGDGTVHRARWDGSQHTELVTSAIAANAVAVDSDGLYWTEAGSEPDYLDGRLRRSNLDGSGVVTLADGLTYPNAVTTDVKAVYVSVRGTPAAGLRNGMIVKVAKP
jgi:hypothetical protein